MYRSSLVKVSRVTPHLKKHIRSMSTTIPTHMPSKTPVLLGLGVTACGLFYYHQRILHQLCDPVLMPLMRLLDPETAHELAVKAAKYGLIPKVVSLCELPYIHIDFKRCRFRYL
jgi:hypothetical protein